MVSPARRHFEAETAAQAAENGEVDLSKLTAYQRLLKNLHGDKTILKSISGMADKIKAKAGMLPNYQDWVDGVLAGQHAQPDDKITPTVLVWMIDCGWLDAAMPLAQFAMQHGLSPTDEYQRSMPEIIVEQYAEQIAQGSEISDGHLQELISWAVDKGENGLHQYNMPDQIRAKLLKAAGERKEEQGEWKEALQCYESALAYNEKAGVKKRIEALNKQIAQTEAS